MILNHLYVVPTPDTANYFSANVAGSPFAIDVNTFYVSLFFSTDNIEPDPNAVYAAQLGNMRLFPSDNGLGSDLILPLISPPMQQVHDDLDAELSDAILLPYSPHITVVRNIPPLKRYIKSWINSLSATFLRDNRIFTFGPEVLETKDYEEIPDQYYLRAMEAMTPK